MRSGILAKVTEDQFTTTDREVLTVIDNKIDVLEATMLIKDETTLTIEGVGGTKEKKTMRESSISSCASRLLIEGIERLGDRKVNDESNVSLIDAKTKGNRCNNDLNPIIRPVSLSFGLLCCRNVCMIRSRPYAMLLDGQSNAF